MPLPPTYSASRNHIFQESMTAVLPATIMSSPSTLRKPRPFSRPTNLLSIMIPIQPLINSVIQTNTFPTNHFQQTHFQQSAKFIFFPLPRYRVSLLFQVEFPTLFRTNVITQIISILPSSPILFYLSDTENVLFPLPCCRISLQLSPCSQNFSKYQPR